METDMNKTARLTGIFYLSIIICAGFSQGYVRNSLFLPGDPETTLINIVVSEGLFRLGLVADLIAFMLDAAIAILFYQLLKEVNKTLAVLAAAFRLLAHPAIASLNLLNHYMALETATSGGYLSVLGMEQQKAWTMLYLQAHNYGYLLAGALFSVHCFLLGILLYKSDLFPSIFGILIMVAASGYMIETFGNIIMPGNEAILANIVGFSAVIGEVSLALYLTVKGARKKIIF